MRPLLEPEQYETGTGQTLTVHGRSECVGEFCVIHNPSEHVMREFRTHWRGDRSLMERICPHGIGHPDPDDIAAKKLLVDDYERYAFEVHGCDGCCGATA